MYIYIFPALTDSTTTSISNPGLSCPPGMFLCDYLLLKCVSILGRCDGVYDCWDKTDEKGCPTTTKTTPKTTIKTTSTTAASTTTSTTTSLSPQGILFYILYFKL